MAGIIERKEMRSIRTHPRRSARRTPNQVITVPREKRMVRMKLPSEGEACRT